MPFRFTCKECGEELLVDESPFLSVRAQTEKHGVKCSGYGDHTLRKIGYRCPFCGRMLQWPPSTIEVKARFPK